MSPIRRHDHGPRNSAPHGKGFGAGAVCLRIPSDSLAGAATSPGVALPAVLLRRRQGGGGRPMGRHRHRRWLVLEGSGHRRCRTWAMHASRPALTFPHPFPSFKAPMNKIIRALVSVTLVHLASQPSRAEGAHHQGGTATVRGGQIQAQPWDDPAGSWRLRLFLSSLDSQASYNADGQHIPNPSGGSFSNNSLNAFAEYALTSRWSVSALTSFQKIENRNDATKESWSSIGDTYGWVRRSLDDVGGFTPALLFGIKIPGNYPAISGAGDAQVDGDVQALLTKRISTRSYLTGAVGYRLRLGEISDEIPYGLHLGWSPVERWTLIASANGARGIGSGIQKDFFNLGGSLQWSINASWSMVGSYNRIISGRNTVDAKTWSLGIAYR